MQHIEEEIFKNFSKTPVERSRKQYFFMIYFRNNGGNNAFSGHGGGFATFF